MIPDIRAGFMPKSSIHPMVAAGLVPKSKVKPKVPTHPAGRVTAIDESTGLPIVQRAAEHIPPPDIPPTKIGKEEPRTGREILHASNDPEVIQQAVIEKHPDIKADLNTAIAGIKGAALHGARDEKNPERIEEKVQDEGQNPRTIPDYSGFRISVDTREAKNAVVAAIRKAFKVVREKDEFEKGAEDTEFHAHMMQIQDAGDLVTHEVQVLPKSVADTAEASHGLYEKARTGDRVAAKMMKAKNQEAWNKFEKPSSPVKSDKVGTLSETEKPSNETKPASGETKYKFGSTQANIPETSDAHAGLMAAAKKIDPADLNPTSYGGDDKGLEPDPHVTVRYGVQGEDTAELEKFIRSLSPFQAKLGKTSSFPPSDSSDGGAVIKADIESPELHRINAEIEKHGDFAPSSFPDYVPHATVAYVKPDAIQKYVGMTETEGKTFPVNSIAITDRNGDAKEIPLEGGTKQSTNSDRKGGRGESPEQATGAAAQSTPAATPTKSDAKVKTGATVRLPDGRTGVVKGISPKGDVEVKLDGGGRAKSTRSAVQVIDKEAPSEGVTVGTPGHEKPSIGAIAVDLDKTLAEYDGYKGPTVIGKPIAAQVDQVKQMLADGKDVWIFTARVDHPEAIPAIQTWTRKHIGQELPVTNVKHAGFAQFIDDRAELPVQMK